MDTTTVVTTEQLVTLLVGVVAPIIVGLITRASTSSSTKALLLAGIAALTGIGTAFLAATPEQPFSWQVAVFNAVSAFIVSVATHYGLYKPVGATDWAQRTLVKDQVDLAA